MRQYEVMGIVDRLQALDDRFLPAWTKLRRSEGPAEWTPDVGPLVPAWNTPATFLFIGGFVVLGGLLCVIDLLQEGRVILATVPLMALLNAASTRLFSRRLLQRSAEEARPVPIDVPTAASGKVLTSVLAMAAVATLMMMGLAVSRDSIGIPGGVSLGTALSMELQRRWIRRWERDNGAELLVALQWRSLCGRLYIRKVPAPHPAREFLR